MVCRICEKRISSWMIENRKVAVINDEFYHTACLQDTTIVELEKLNEDEGRNHLLHLQDKVR